jgi:hypothetical protein
LADVVVFRTDVWIIALVAAPLVFGLGAVEWLVELRLPMCETEMLKVIGTYMTIFPVYAPSLVLLCLPSLSELSLFTALETVKKQQQIFL